jgi:hypothetical protein
MKRLVYSPKIMSYVNTEKGVLDITDYVVSGNVNRVVNEISTAEIQIRNPGKMFTTPGDPTFHPMDQITIFGSRYKYRPVQLFTGYLDSTPYLQLFPGTCTLRASCSLKRLLHTYWDAGLPHTIDYLAKFGWLPNPKTGTMFHGQANAANNKNPGKDVNQDELKDAILLDGNIGNLLFNIMRDIGNWGEDNLYIEKLPRDIITNVSEIVKTFEKDDDETRKELDSFLSDLIGEYSPGMGGTPSSGGGPITLTGEGPKSGSVVSPEEVGVAMLRAGFPQDEKVLASGMETMEAESGFGTTPGWDVEHDAGVLGYWQVQKSSWGITTACAMNLYCSTEWAYKIWKEQGGGCTSAQGCFACCSGPNPWQGGTDNGTKYLDVARRVIDAWKNRNNGSSGSAGSNTGAAGDAARD